MSDWREQAKAALEEAMGYGYSSLDNLLGALVDAAAPAVRADEAERTLDRWLASDHVERVLDVREAEVRERLRAQVEALLHWTDSGGAEVVEYAAVLALLGGESDA